MYLFFDTETTGLPKNRKAPVSDLNNWPRLVQIAWLQYDSSEKQISSCNHIIKPQGFTIPYDAAKVHSISTERAINEGVSLRIVLNEFSKAISQSMFLVAHNMSFDEKIVGAEFLRENIPNSLFQTSRICIMVSSTDFCQIPGSYGYKYPTLSELHFELFNTSFKETHNAAVEVRACAKCFFELKRIGVIRVGNI